ncbi:epidermal growth factor receptor kinase substrate 8-like protein 1a [Chanos chanos]|uniref:Epidermal growth factor receptor kinase substrate 8-like protein 1a n=1 Tax=Chanos chanos TaxID=29144 RepID=A0A6J2WY73_CHACN|nr:epidermal growth factor receptor kinase substrate 8-like protein 1 [Chanos chanos]
MTMILKYLLPVNGNIDKTSSFAINAEREVELLNHCFADVERFMGRLQLTAEAKSTLDQRNSKKKKSGRKKSSKKDKKAEDDLEQKALPPSEEEFTGIFQKIKYSLSLLDRLKNEISDPNSEELLQHIFIPLNLLVKTTGGPELAAGVSSPALTGGAVTLLQQNLTEEEKELWTSLGPNWTQSYSELGEGVSPYTPVFLDGWQPEALDRDGQPFKDPIECQHGHEALIANHKDISRARCTYVENSVPPEGERMYKCSYDFVARNSSELSVLQGEVLEVIESSKRWWKCKNSYDQIGFVPYNILEPVSALNHTEVDSGPIQRQSVKSPLTPPGAGRFSYAAPNSPVEVHSLNDPRPVSMPPSGEDGEKVMIMNDELLQRLTNGRGGSVRPVTITRANETSAPLNYHSPPAEVEEWLRGKGFNDSTVQSLGILTGAQLFSLNKEELRTVSPEEGTRVYSQITVQKALLEDVRKATELEAIMQKQKMKVDLKMEAGL